MSFSPIGPIVFSVSPTCSSSRLHQVVIQALQRNGISFVSFDKGGKIGGDVVGKFLKNESITVFLLHAEKER